MASSEKTPKFGLCQWALTDAVKMEDFNRDNRIVEALLSERPACRIELLYAPCRVKTDFVPETVLAVSADGGAVTLAIRGRETDAVTVEETGFSLNGQGMYLTLTLPAQLPLHRGTVDRSAHTV